MGCRGATGTKGKRQRGEIETLPSGSMRVGVYAGIDPLTSKRHYLTEIVPAGPRAEEAEKARTRLLAQVDERRNPRTKATVGQMLDRHLDMLDVKPTTRDSYDGLVWNHIKPLLGQATTSATSGASRTSAVRSLPPQC